MLEGQCQEVQSRLSFCHAPVVNRVTVLAEDRQVHRVATAVLCREGLEFLGVPPRGPPLLLAIGHVGRLVQNELGEGQGMRRRVECEARAGGMAVH